MVDLKDALDALYELNELRTRAKELREQGRLALRNIEDTRTADDGTAPLPLYPQDLPEGWISSGNNVEVALLVKVQNHQDISDDEEENDRTDAAEPLKKKLRELELQKLFPSTDYNLEIQNEEKGDRRIPVLVAARSMQALVSRSDTVFSKATMLCYYRIVLELYVAARPDWTIGAARAGKGGTTSAFVTGECIRAIFAFEDAIKRTAHFFKQTDRLLGRYRLLKSMLSVLETEPPKPRDSGTHVKTSGAKSPMELWADKAIERMWFDWHISTNPREGNIALGLGGTGAAGNQLFLNPEQAVNMKSVGEYLEGLREKLQAAVSRAQGQISDAKKEISTCREEQGKFFDETPQDDADPVRVQHGPQRDFEKRLREYDRTESAHKFALALIGKAEKEGTAAAKALAADLSQEGALKKIFTALQKQFAQMAAEIHRVLEPSERYIRTVLYREVASNDFVGRFDAGELVFAAASYGAMTNWKTSELLARACNLLVETLPENGRLPTTRPFHSTLKGHRMLPIGCEMTRSFAQLMQRTSYEFTPAQARRMLNIFEEKLIKLDPLGEGPVGNRVAWNFHGSPDPNSPCVWVTAVSVLAIDRVVRMLNDRINSIVFKYFEVIRPEKPHSDLSLNDLVYPDYGLIEYYQSSQRSVALRLEQMRAHVRRVTLPEMFKDKRERKEQVFSAIFYGPPGTGKTTLAEALAFSSKVPLIRLSPSDLVVQGPAAIEGRARAVFEALSMLTQVVIIFDEFEDVVGQRVERKGADGNTGHDEGKIFEFLRTGMLPKLVKLNESARKQSFVYCLATNYFENIDPAAKRRGRFDVHMPVYDPDPMSRAGTILYRLFRVVERLKKDGVLSKEPEFMVTRFLKVVEMTKNTRASSFANEYLRLPKWIYEHALDRPKGFENEISLFWYILTGEEDKGFADKNNLLKEEQSKTIEEHKKFLRSASQKEKDESKWLRVYESKLTEVLSKGPVSLEEVSETLIGPHPGLVKAAGTE